MSTVDPRLFRLRRLLDRFSEGRSGSTALEFAMLALPFLGLLFAIIDLGMVFLIATTLANATTDAARQIRTCQVQTQGGATATTFTTLVCNEMNWLGANCSANLKVNVNTYSTFATTNGQSAPVSGGKITTGSLAFTTGGPGSIVLVQTYYPWTLPAPFLDGAITQLSNNQALVTASTAFRNEPCNSSS